MLRLNARRLILQQQIALHSRRYSTKYPPPYAYYEKRKPRAFRRFLWLSFLAGATLSYTHSIHELAELYSALPSEDNPQAIAEYINNLENELNALPLVKKLKSETLTGDKHSDPALRDTHPSFTVTRTWDQVDTTPTGLSSFHGAIAHPGGIAIAPINFHNQETGDDITIIHVGKRLSGYPMIVHGGMLGTILDEVFKKNVGREFNLPIENIHTTKLDIKYRFPCFVNQFVVVRSNAKVDDDGNFIVTGNLQTIDNRLLIKSEAIFKSNTNPSNGGPNFKKGWIW